MISATEAEKLILENAIPGPAVAMPIADVHGEILRETITADRPFPPYHRVAMDGIAFSRDSWNGGRRVFSVAGTQRAGEPPRKLNDPDSCYEVMTGAVLPEGCDCVVPVEQIELENGAASLKEPQTVTAMQNVHMMGCDRDRDTVLLDKGAVMFGPQCAIAATVGKAGLLVAQRPNVAVVSTGDELVSVSDVPEPHQIRASNGYALKASLRQAGFSDVETRLLPDDADVLGRELRDLLASCPFLLVSGGVSAGRYDLVPEVLDSLGVRQVFHKVRHRPGMPLWFGVGPDGQSVFGLPGNPVAGVVCCYRYVLPALWQSMGAALCAPDRRPRLPLAETVRFEKPLALFKAVTIRVTEEGTRCAAPVRMGGSGDLAGLAESDGFVELPAEQDVFEVGTRYPVWLWSEPYAHIARVEGHIA